MALKPMKQKREARYPKLAGRMVRGIVVLATMSASTLGGCGGVVDSRTIDSALDNGDLDGTVGDCDSGTTDCGTQ